jgi:hypothetical protein
MSKEIKLKFVDGEYVHEKSLPEMFEGLFPECYFFFNNDNFIVKFGAYKKTLTWFTTTQLIETLINELKATDKLSTAFIETIHEIECFIEKNKSTKVYVFTRFS